MADLWYPGGVRDPCDPGLWGAHTGGRPKFALHTTEGPTGVYTPDPRRGPDRRYYGHTHWPTYTLAHAAGRPGGWGVYQHMPADRAARALANRPGGVQTNTCNVSQIEIACRAAEIRSLPAEAVEELARLLAWEHAARGVPLESTVRWVAYPASYGEGAAQRLPGPAWDAYSGVLGHQHVPENQHGDPGEFPIEALLARAIGIAAHPTTPRPEGDMTEQDKTDIVNGVLAALHAQVFDVSPPIRQGNAGQVIGATYNKVGDVQAVLGPASRDGSVLARLEFIAAEVGDVKRGLVHVAADAAVVMERAPEPAAAALALDRVREFIAGVTDQAALFGLVQTAMKRWENLRAGVAGGPGELPAGAQ